MLRYILMFIFSVIGGVAGGMGMGGGTLLVPLFSFLKMSQHSVQAVNLISFLPMSVIALLIHRKNGLVKTKHTLWIILPAVATAVLGAFLARHTGEKTLRTAFGVFLLLVGIWQGVWAFIGGKTASES